MEESIRVASEVLFIAFISYLIAKAYVIADKKFWELKVIKEEIKLKQMMKFKEVLKEMNDEYKKSQLLMKNGENECLEDKEI